MVSKGISMTRATHRQFHVQGTRLGGSFVDQGLARVTLGRRGLATSTEASLGRRALSLLATGGMCASFVFGTICAAQFVKIGETAAANAEIAFIFIYHVFCNGAWPALRVGYAVEISHCIQASC
ncbi:hypothetical protein JHW43_002032 [Diplocarpon mali]|nr:hypothetical protein JHW43_002032 [Diplocarpon mali]